MKIETLTQTWHATIRFKATDISIFKKQDHMPVPSRLPITSQAQDGEGGLEIGNCVSELSRFEFQVSKTMEITVGMGEIRVTESPHLLKAIGIGSCVAVALYDMENGIGGLAHVMLPCFKEAHDKSNTTKFTDIAIAMMIEEMKRRGARPQSMTAKIFGGANMFPEIISSDSAMDIGKRNVAAVREELEGYNIQIAASEVGGHIGRTVIFDTADNSVTVKTANLEERTY